MLPDAHRRSVLLVRQQVGRAEGRTHQRQQLLVAHHVELQPAAVARLVDAHQRRRRGAALAEHRHVAAGQRTAGHARGRPKPVRQQRGMHHAPLAGSLAVQERGDDAGVERDARGVVAHAGEALGRARAGLPHEVHQAAARPVGELVEALALALGALLAIGREGGVDHARIARAQVFVGEAHRLARRIGLVGHEDVAAFGEAVHDLEPALGLQIQRQAALVASVLLPEPVAGIGDARHP